VVVFTLSAPASLQAQVVNIAGRAVRTLALDYAGQAGVNTLAWDGRSDQGSLVPNGTYLVRLLARDAQGAQSQATAACTVIR
jgi:flagellar hook assembly protein FlgD